jgi:predicted nuclease of predicted toxin-antitoxin system
VRIVIDMNLSHDWIEFLRSDGHEAMHWSILGEPDASDEHIVEWARTNNALVGALLTIGKGRVRMRPLPFN